MEISIIKKEKGGRLVCVRKDGSTAITNMGPSLPYHDLAHFVVEKTLNMCNGFYGNIEAGYSVEELSGKEVIQTLPAGAYLAEVITRALQSLSVGACTEEQFIALIQQEADVYALGAIPPIKAQQIKRMHPWLLQLIQQWNSLPEGEALKLEW